MCLAHNADAGPDTTIRSRSSRRVGCKLSSVFGYIHVCKGSKSCPPGSAELHRVSASWQMIPNNNQGSKDIELHWYHAKPIYQIVKTSGSHSAATPVHCVVWYNSMEVILVWLFPTVFELKSCFHSMDFKFLNEIWQCRHGVAYVSQAKRWCTTVSRQSTSKYKFPTKLRLSSMHTQTILSFCGSNTNDSFASQDYAMLQSLSSLSDQQLLRCVLLHSSHVTCGQVLDNWCQVWPYLPFMSLTQKHIVVNFSLLLHSRQVCRSVVWNLLKFKNI